MAGNKDKPRKPRKRAQKDSAQAEASSPQADDAVVTAASSATRLESSAASPPRLRLPSLGLPSIELPHLKTSSFSPGDPKTSLKTQHKVFFALPPAVDQDLEETPIASTSAGIIAGQSISSTLPSALGQKTQSPVTNTPNPYTSTSKSFRSIVRKASSLGLRQLRQDSPEDNSTKNTSSIIKDTSRMPPKARRGRKSGKGPNIGSIGAKANAEATEGTTAADAVAATTALAASSSQPRDGDGMTEEEKQAWLADLRAKMKIARENCLRNLAHEGPLPEAVQWGKEFDEKHGTMKMTEKEKMEEPSSKKDLISNPTTGKALAGFGTTSKSDAEYHNKINQIRTEALSKVFGEAAKERETTRMAMEKDELGSEFDSIKGGSQPSVAGSTLLSQQMYKLRLSMMASTSREVNTETSGHDITSGTATAAANSFPNPSAAALALLRSATRITNLYPDLASPTSAMINFDDLPSADNPFASLYAARQQLHRPEDAELRSRHDIHDLVQQWLRDTHRESPDLSATDVGRLVLNAITEEGELQVGAVGDDFGAQHIAVAFVTRWVDRCEENGW